MAKKKKTEEPKEVKPFIITAAVIKDGFCNYSFEEKTGVNAGDSHNVKGMGIVDDDMIEAFQKLNVHLACLDDIFKHSELEISDIDKEHNNELVALYEVTGFSIKGSEDAESIILIGSKGITASGERIEIKTPKIPLDSLSSYVWWKELKEASDECRMEVELYKGGKHTKDEEKLDPKQMNAFAGSEVDFESAKA